MKILRRRRISPDGEMSVVEHLNEFRYRLIVSIVAIAVGAVVAYIVYRPLLDFLLHPLAVSGGKVGDIQVIDPVTKKPIVFIGGVSTAFFLRLRISSFAGLVFALPVVLYQLWRFITPGLHPREKRFAVPFVACAVALFALGTFIAFKVLPAGLQFLLSFVPPAEPLIQLPEYINFTMFAILGFGLAFQFPLILIFLGIIDVLPSRTLASKRRMAIVLAFVVGAIATPGGDPVTQSVLAAALYVLYEISILVIRFVLKR